MLGAHFLSLNPGWRSAPQWYETACPSCSLQNARDRLAAASANLAGRTVAKSLHAANFISNGAAQSTAGAHFLAETALIALPAGPTAAVPPADPTVPALQRSAPAGLRRPTAARAASSKAIRQTAPCVPPATCAGRPRSGGAPDCRSRRRTGWRAAHRSLLQ